ncbi:capsular biosynthesis protein [Shimia sp. R11_0]|uniref:capsular polysaccharide export protein, LipB/KpsS family n=1 Tax=Shimia sp. R11_0 TaxID=2821096 RepID=UPI001ADAAD2C|nr:capsular biosynthesis protein [Shimia sp. R11_0]
MKEFNAATWAVKPPRLLLLQGPVGPFFKELALELENQGAEVQHMVFGPHDSAYTARSCAVAAVSDLTGFQKELTQILKTGIDVVVLFGSERPAHKIARHIADLTNTPVVCFEEGYIRPGFITCEFGGNNASSPIAKWDLSELDRSQTSRRKGTNFKGFWPMVWYGFNVYLRRGLFANRRQREYFHRELPLTSEAFHWSRNVFRKYVIGPRHHAVLRSLTQKHSGNIFVVALQVPSDANILKAAKGWNTPKLVERSIGSFARHAPATAQLVFKIHPMARGHSNDQELINKTARKHGIQDRVKVVHEGSIAELMGHTSGMLTINSTSGLSALHHGVPVLVFGQSIFTHSQLVSLYQSNEDIDRFWTAGFTAPAEVRQAFLHKIEENSLVPGDFYAANGRKQAVLHSAKKILESARVPELVGD